MRPVRLATCSAFPEGDEDAAVLTAALADLDLEAQWTVWDADDLDWTAAPVVLRATWDYPLARDRFLEWVASLPSVHNPAPLVAWNSDKVYLRELQEAGVPTTPTAVVAPGEAIVAPAREFVVKPSVGAGSRGVGRFTSAAAGQAHAEQLHAAGLTAIVQPYLAGVDEAGETALMYVEGAFSHAIRKAPMLGSDVVHDIDRTTGLFVQEVIMPRTPSEAELTVGDLALDHVRHRFGTTPLYARVDLLPGADGPVLVELELIEPSLFLSYAEGSAARFAAAIAART